MPYIIVAVLLLLLLAYLGREAYLAYLEEEEMKMRKEPIITASEELDSLNLSHEAMDVKEKVVESKQSLQKREQNLESKYNIEVEPDVSVTVTEKEDV